MKTVRVFKSPEGALIQGAGKPAMISNEMAECFIRQYRLMGWTEERVTSSLWCFYQREE